MCPHCGIQNPGRIAGSGSGTPSPAGSAGPSVGLNHRRAFDRFDANGGRFVPTWNWAAFLSAVIWYFYKGIWLKGLVLVGMLFLTGGTAFLLIWLYCGIAGNYDFYLLATRGKQLY